MNGGKGLEHNTCIFRKEGLFKSLRSAGETVVVRELGKSLPIRMLLYFKEISGST